MTGEIFRGAVEIPEDRRRWVKGVLLGPAMVAGFLAILVFVPGGMTVRIGAFVMIAAGCVTFVKSALRLVSRLPQVWATAEGVTVKTWRGARFLSWDEVRAVEPVKQVDARTAAFFRGAGQPSAMMEATSFNIRFRDRFFQGVLVTAPDGVDLAAVRREILALQPDRFGQ